MILVGMGQAQAVYQWDGLRPLFIGGTLMAGSTVLGSGMGTTGSASGGSTAVMAVVGVIAALSGVTASSYFSSLPKELVVQLKVDHETYLAGGEMTPLLQEVYRGVLTGARCHSRPDSVSGKEVIDEAKMTAAIDRLVAMVDSVHANSLESIPRSTECLP